jgi:cytochrome c
LAVELELFMRMTFVTAAAILVGLASGAIAAGDADNGKNVFKKCMACHRIGDGATNLVGPALTGVVGRKAGTFEGFNYSTTMKNAGDQGLTWDEKSIGDYLPDPSAFLKKYLTDKGKPELASDTPKMTFKLADPGDIADVIAYLKTFSK